MEKQKIQNSQHNMEEEQVRGLALHDFETYYKAVSSQDRWVLVKKQTKRSIEQTRGPRNRPRQTH